MLNKDAKKKSGVVLYVVIDMTFKIILTRYVAALKKNNFSINNFLLKPDKQKFFGAEIATGLRTTKFQR